MLKLQDLKLDFEAKLENIDEQEHGLREEIIQLSDKLQGKDTALTQLSKKILEQGQENEKLAEMVTFFKNKLLYENVFHTTFAATLLAGGDSLAPFKSGQSLIFGFIRDNADQEEYFLKIESKKDNSKTGERDVVRIPVDLIDEIEHEEGTMTFYVHYQVSQGAQQVNGTGLGAQITQNLGNFLKKKLKKAEEVEEGKFEERSVQFESKFVK